MIEYNDETQDGLVECDSCSNYLELPNIPDFIFFVKEIKELGWRNIKTDEGWIHKCPKCSGCNEPTSAGGEDEKGGV